MASRWRRSVVLVALVLLSALPPGFGARAAPSHPSIAATPQWTTGGPYADDATAVAASPAFDADHTVFLGVSYRINTGQPAEQAIAAVLRSSDAGATWATAWSDASAQGTTQTWLNQIVVSPAFATDRTVFALWAGAGGGVLRSTDGGASFQPVNVGTGAFAATSKTLSISPAYGADRTIAVTADAGTTAASYLSADGGTTWAAVAPTGTDSCNDALTGGGFLLALGNGTLGSYLPNASAVCANDLDQRYAVSQNWGLTWARGGDIQAAVGGTNFDTQHSRLVAAPDGTAILYTDQYGNAVRSADGGATWQNLIAGNGTLGHDTPPDATPGNGPYYNFRFQTATSVYAVHEWGKLANPRVYHSADGGATWGLTWQAQGATAPHEAAGAGMQTLFFAGGNLGLVRSTDRGQTWQAVGSFLPQHPAVAVSPAFASDHSAFTVTYPGGLPTTGQDSPAFGIYRSANGGTAWSEPQAPTPVQGAGFGTVFTTSVQGGMSLAVSPNYATDHTIFEGDRIGAVAISRDGGRTWATSLPGTPPQEGWYVNALAVSPNYAADRVVYWGGGPGGFGVFKSVDGGQSWVQVTPADRVDQISAAQVHGLAISPEASGVLDLAVAIGHLYLARDNPASAARQEWRDLGLSTAYTVALSPDYQRDCTMYASMWPGPSGIGATLDDGVYISTNACAANAGAVTWTRLTGGLPVRDFDTIALSPNFPADHTLVIGSYSAGVYLSTDAGQTWTPFSAGLGNLTVHQLALAAGAPVGSSAAAASAPTGVLFAATDGGVWQTPVPLAPVASPAPSFADVPAGYWAHDPIGTFAQRGITTGCDTNLYCPERPVTRAEMAVFLDRTLGFPNPATPASQRFSDVSPAYWAYAFIDRFAQLGVTTGCGGTEFCPDRGVTRAEMAAFLIRALKQPQATPATPTFADVPPSHPQFGYIEALVKLGVTTGCGTNDAGQRLYCPDRGVTRAEMAVFIIRAFP